MSVNELENVVRRKMVRPPNFRPKTRYGQHTMGRNPNTSIQYLGLKREYSENPVQLQPLINERRRAILMDAQLLGAEEGIYTWILKRGHLYATKLITNQEIGTLHANLDVLTLHRNNVRNIQHNTLKNKRSAEAKPSAAGEFLLVRDEVEEAKGNEANRVRLYFNLQSGTYSEPALTCRAKALGTTRGLNAKAVKQAIHELKLECRDDMIDEVKDRIIHATGLPVENVRFLSCTEEIQRELEAIPLLHTGYVHGVCRDDDDYLENVAGRNLIRRFMAFTSVNHRQLLNTYFRSEPEETSSILVKRSTPGNIVTSTSSKKGRRKVNNTTTKQKLSS